MKLLIDDEIFIWQKFGGVSRVFTELIKRAKVDPGIDLSFTCLYTENEYALKENWNMIPPVLRKLDVPGKGKLLRSMLQLYSHFRIRAKLKYAANGLVFHPSFITEHYLDILKSSTRLVFTVHDLIHEKFPKNQLYRQQANIKRMNIERADRIIAVSQSTKNDLLQFYPFVKDQNVSVIHLANPLTTDSVSVSGLPETYVLFTGVRAGYKNFELVLRAMGYMPADLSHVQLVCTGGGRFSPDELKLIAQYGLEKKIHLRSFTDAELRHVYQNAALFVFPSRYEGFGMPVLEAMASSVPCVLSDIPVLRETGGDAAIYFNPDHADELAESIHSVLTNSQLRVQMIQSGIARQGTFSWDKCYADTFQVYSSLA